MRISSRAVVDHVLVNLQRNLARLDRLQNQLSSGKRVQFPSDDPASAALAMRLHSAVLENEQYLKNARAGIAWLETTDSALQDVVQTLHRARELIIAGARSDLPPSARQALADEMDQLVRHLVDVGNTTHGGRYVLGGYKTDARPFTPNEGGPNGWLLSVAYNGSKGSSPDTAPELQIEVGPGVQVPISVAGPHVFGGDGTELLTRLMDARDHLLSGAVDQLSGQDLADLDAGLDRVLRMLDRVGARQQGLQLVVQRLEGGEVNLKELLSNTEDLDVTKAITDLQMQENVYRLALASAARIIQPTLLDFLR